MEALAGVTRPTVTRERKCANCGNTFPLEHFPLFGTEGNGKPRYRSLCSTCWRTMRRAQIADEAGLSLQEIKRAAKRAAKPEPTEPAEPQETDVPPVSQPPHPRALAPVAQAAPYVPAAGGRFDLLVLLLERLPVETTWTPTERERWLRALVGCLDVLVPVEHTEVA